MKSRFKNANKHDILKRLKELKAENFPFQQPMLQLDTFWIYCNARRYFGTYRNALNQANIVLKDDCVRSEFGQKIDWWQFKDSHIQREWLAIVLRCLWNKCINISPKGLKNSPYFDIYTDAVNLFGKFESVLEYSDISQDMPRCIDYPNNESIFRPIIEMYYCDSHEQRCKLLKEIDSDFEKDIETTYQSTAESTVIVDAANIAYVGKKASLANVKAIDLYLQQIGFRKEKIIFIFDAAFRYGVDKSEFDALIREDPRYCQAPAGEQADAHILTKAYEQFRKEPKFPPLIISNDQYAEYFQKHPELERLKERKRGVTWTFILKEPKPVINLLRLEG